MCRHIFTSYRYVVPKRIYIPVFVFVSKRVRKGHCFLLRAAPRTLIIHTVGNESGEDDVECALLDICIMYIPYPGFFSSNIFVLSPKELERRGCWYYVPAVAGEERKVHAFEPLLDVCVARGTR